MRREFIRDGGCVCVCMRACEKDGGEGGGKRGEDKCVMG